LWGVREPLKFVPTGLVNVSSGGKIFGQLGGEKKPLQERRKTPNIKKKRGGEKGIGSVDTN